MNQAAEHHAASRALRDRALARVIDICLTPQVLLEYFAVVTSPSHLTRPLPPSDALADVEKLAAAFPLVHPPADLHERGLANGISHIYTYDEGFGRIPGITALRP